MTVAGRKLADDTFEVLSAIGMGLRGTAEAIVSDMTPDQARAALLYLAEGYVGMLEGLARVSGTTTVELVRRLASLRQEHR